MTHVLCTMESLLLQLSFQTSQLVCGFKLLVLHLPLLFLQLLDDNRYLLALRILLDIVSHHQPEVASIVFMHIEVEFLFHMQIGVFDLFGLRNRRFQG